MNTYLGCPRCARLLHYDDFQLEGEIETPRPEDPYECQGCGWQGSFRELLPKQIIAPPPELDYQI